MAGPRSATIEISRPIVFRPFSSVTTPAQNTKTPTFELLIPTLGDGAVDLAEATWPTRRFVYVFLDQVLLTIVAKNAFLLSFFVGPPVPGNPLLMVVQVDPDGKEAVCYGGLYKAALTAGTPPPFVARKSTEAIALEPDSGGLSDSYAVAAPILLPLSAITTLEAQRPAVVPTLGTSMSLGVIGTPGSPSAKPAWVFPIVDPLLIADDLTRKYYETADNFLATSQEIDRPPARTSDERSARREGELQRLRKAIADNILGLKKAAPNLASSFNDGLRNSFPERFNFEYGNFVNNLVFEREVAAFHLVAWLETALFTQADDWWARKQGRPDPDYENYVSVVTRALARLAESDRGVQYLMDLKTRFDQATSPAPSGVLNVTSEFVLRTTQSSAEQLALAEKTALAVFQTWSGLLAAVLAVRQRVVKVQNKTTTLAQDVSFFTQSLAFTFQTQVLNLTTTGVQLESPVPGLLTDVIDIPLNEFQVGPVRRLLRRTKLTTDHLSRVSAVLNFAMAYAALRDALDGAGDARAQAMAMSDLAGASFGLIDQVQALPVLEAFRSRMAGKLDMGGALLGNRLSSTLGLLGAVASLTSASLATADSFDKGDWDQGVAHVTEGFGAVLTGVGSTMILLSGATGPFALWSLGLGAAFATVGFVWSVFAADTEIDQMLKFCVFGVQHKSGARKPPGWTQCLLTFDEWDGDSPRGLLKQLKAFQQLFFSFDASGATSVAPGPLASDGILRLTPASLRLASSFEIAYTAVYSLPNGSAAPVTRAGKATVAVQKTLNAPPTLVDDKNNYDTVGAIRVHRDGGRDAMDIRLRLLVPLVDKATGQPLELESLTCLVQLKVPDLRVEDDGSTDPVLVVPTTVLGPQTVSVTPVKARNIDLSPQRSVAVT